MKKRSRNRTSLIGVILLAVVLAMSFPMAADAGGAISIYSPDPDNGTINPCNGAYVLRSAQEAKISWIDNDGNTSQDIVSSDIYVSIAGGSWSPTAQVQNVTWYYWAIPADFIHNNVRIKVVAKYNNGVTAEAVSKTFNCIDGRQPTATVKPFAQSSYYVGDPVNIQWQAACTGSYAVERVDLSFINSGSNWGTFVQLTGDAAKSGSYTWNPTAAMVTDKGQISARVWCSNCTDTNAINAGSFEVKNKPSGDSAWTEAERPFTKPSKPIPSGSNGWTQNMVLPEVVVDAAGSIHVAAAHYADTLVFDSNYNLLYREAEDQIFYRKKSQSGWITQEQVTKYASMTAKIYGSIFWYEIRNIEMAVDSNGYPHIVYEFAPAPAETSYSEIWYVYKNQSGWQAPYKLSDAPSAKCRSPKIAIDKSDNLYAFWYERHDVLAQIMVAYRVKKNGVWSAKQAPPGINRAPLDIVTDNQNVLKLIGRDASGNLYHARLENGVWSSPQLITNENYGDRDALFSIRDQLYITGGYGAFYLLSDKNGSWNKEMYPWTESTTDNGFKLLDTGSGLQAVYSGYNQNQTYMMARTYDGSSWSDYKVISLNYTERAFDKSYSADGNGSLSAVAWSGKYNGQTDIFLSYSKNSSLPQSIALNGQVLSTTAPFSVKFTVDAQSPVSGYKYFFGNGDTQTSSVNTVTYSYKEAGTYTVSVVATNSNGTNSTATTSITVGQPLHPKISVKQGSTEIADGGSFSVGSAKTGSYSDTTFTINNVGNANLTIGSVSETSADFEIIETPLPVVTPGNQTSFTVRFQPASAGNKSAVIQFSNNDDFGKNPFNFTVSSTALNPPTAPEIEVRHGSTVIPNQGTYTMQNILAVGSSQDMPFTFYNTGNATLTIGTISESSNDFSILQQPTEILAGKSVDIVVQYKPLTAGSKSLTLQFKTNDADENPFSFTITGKAVANQPPTVSMTICQSSILPTSSYTFKWSGADSDGSISKYFYGLDDPNPAVETTATSYTSTNMSSGSHTFYVKAMDNSGAYSTVKECSFSINFNPRPSISISKPLEAEVITQVNPEISVAGSAKDDKAISKVEVALNDGSFETVTVTSYGLWGKRFTLKPGANYVVARATDNENAQSTIIVHFTYSPAANQPPILNYSSGWKPLKPIAGQDYVIKLRADDPDNNLDRIDVDWTGKGGADGQVETQYATSSGWGEDMIFTRRMTSAKISWSATAYDKKGGRSNMISVVYPATGLNASKKAATIESSKLKKDCKVNERLKNDPVDTLTGAQVIDHNLLTVKGIVPISFALTYNSLVLDKGLIGIGWGNPSGADSHLKVLPNGSTQVYWSNNRVNNFMSNGDNTFSSSEHASRFDKLVKNDDGSFILTRQDKSVYKFNSGGQLIERGNQQGQSLSYAYDSAGRLSKITEPVSGVFLSYAYNAEGLLESVSDPMNRKVKLGYDANQRLVTITDVAGNVTTYTYNAIGQTLTEVSAEGKQIFSNTYDDEGRVATQDDGIDGNQVSRITYDEDTEPGKIITTATDRNGGKRVYVYDAASYQTLILKDELGKTVAAYEYDEYGNRISATDANGHTTRFAYDAMGHVTAVTDAAGNVTRMTYDSNGNLLSAVNALGKVTSLVYDAKGLLISATDPQGSKTAYSYNSVGQILTVASPAGNVTSFEYQNGLPVRVTSPEGSSRNLQYDAAGRLIRFTDAEGNAYTVSYDESCGSTCRTDTITDPLGNTVRKTYDSKGNLLSVTDAKGNVSRFTYDNNGNMVSLVNALAQETRYEYDGEDRLIRVIDAKGNAAQMSYDPKGRLVKITDALGNSRVMAYDNTHNLLKKTDALGNAILSVSYNALDKPVRVSDVLGRNATFDYDALNHLTKTTDPLSRITQLSYDDLGRLVASADAMGGKSSQAFDKDGNLSGFKDPNGNQTGFTFDKNGRLTAEISASGGQVRYTYTARDLLKQVTNARGQNRQFGYDAAGRVISMTDPDGAVSYAYDKNGNVLTISDSGGIISREYDSLNRVTKYTDAQGNVIQYAYDNVGNMISMTYPDGKQVAYGYDKIDRLVSVTDWAGRVTRYEYDANNRLTRTVRPNAAIMTRSYDNAGQLIQQKDVTPSGEVIVQYDFTYDAAGNITQEKTLPVAEDFPIVPAKMTYSLANRLATYNGQAVQFDSDGNMIKGPLSGAVKDFQFDSRNRLVQGGTVSYTYTAENSRIAVAENGKKSSFVINPAYLSQVLMKTDADGVKTFYVYGLGLIGQEQAGAYLSYHSDLRGSTVALTDDTGLAADRFQYSAYGESVKHTGTTATPFQYNGRDGVMTDENGLYYMRARYYNPEIKRFVNQDVLLGSIDEGQSLNRYAYVNGQPVDFVDPFGYSSTTTLWADSSAIQYVKPATIAAAIPIKAEMWVDSNAIQYVKPATITSGAVAKAAAGGEVKSDLGRNLSPVNDYATGVVQDMVINTSKAPIKTLVKTSIKRASVKAGIATAKNFTPSLLKNQALNVKNFKDAAKPNPLTVINVGIGLMGEQMCTSDEVYQGLVSEDDSVPEKGFKYVVSDIISAGFNIFSFGHFSAGGDCRSEADCS